MALSLQTEGNQSKVISLMAQRHRWWCGWFGNISWLWFFNSLIRLFRISVQSTSSLSLSLFGVLDTLSLLTMLSSQDSQSQFSHGRAKSLSQSASVSHLRQAQSKRRGHSSAGGNVLLQILLPVFDTGSFIALLYLPYSKSFSQQVDSSLRDSLCWRIIPAPTQISWTRAPCRPSHSRSLVWLGPGISFVQ